METTNTLPRVEITARKGGSVEVLLYGDIGFGGLSAQEFASTLNSVKGATEIKLFVNSGGGDVFEAKAMMAQLERAKQTARVIAVVDSLAASAASFLIMAAHEVQMYPEARLMVHEARVMTAGRSSDLRSLADRLDAENESMMNIYASKTKKSPESIREMMAKGDTWFTADEAVAFGLADRIIGEAKPKMAASLTTDSETQRRITALRINQLRSRAGLPTTAGQARKAK